MVKENKVFITFGAGNENIMKAAIRLKNQAKESGFFNRIINYSDKDLRKDKNFWNKHSDFILKNKRMYGYGIWKPYIIKKTLETMNEGDILLYLDAGCEIGGQRQHHFPSFFDYVKKDKIIGSPTREFEKKWTKKDLFLYLELDINDKKIINTDQREAGAILFLNCEIVRTVIDQWCKVGSIYNLVNDSPSKNPNFPDFREHRHDQSVFSLLTKKYNVYSDKDINTCVYYIRNRKGVSKFKKRGFL